MIGNFDLMNDCGDECSKGAGYSLFFISCSFRFLCVRRNNVGNTKSAPTNIKCAFKPALYSRTPVEVSIPVRKELMEKIAIRK